MRTSQTAMRLYAALAFAAGAIAAPSASQIFSIHESLKAAPVGWSETEAADPTTPIALKIALRPSNWESFEDHLIKISTPGHPLYGQHMTKEEVDSWIAPGQEAHEAVMRWIEDAGISNAHTDGQFVHVNAPVAQAQRLLKTDFQVYEHEPTGQQHIRTLQYQVPLSVQKYISTVQPTTRFFANMPKDKIVIPEQLRMQAESVAGEINQQCNFAVTPKCLAELYGFGNFTPSATNGGRIGIAGFLEEWAKYADLQSFLKQFVPSAVGQNFTYVTINGGSNDQSLSGEQDSIEANLDVEYVVGVGHPIPVTYYVTGGRPPFVPDLDIPGPKVTNEPYLEWVTYLLQQPAASLPQVITHSYGEDEQSVPANYSEVVCQAFAQLTARGVSIIFSSGDTGVGSACQSNDGKNTTRFLPIFPASCPYVTSVGGTYRVDPERAVSFSSGGFSDRFARPKYQDYAVQSYLGQLGNKWQGLYNPNGRAYPDVACQAQGFQVFDKGSVTSVGGTSAAAPVFAAIVGMLNSARIDAKMPTMGFLNPWLYTLANATFTDITQGGSNGCTGEDYYSHLPTPLVEGASWPALPGWDAVTGWGTPKFQQLLQLALANGPTPLTAAPAELDLLPTAGDSGSPPPRYGSITRKL